MSKTWLRKLQRTRSRICLGSSEVQHLDYVLAGGESGQSSKPTTHNLTMVTFWVEEGDIGVQKARLHSTLKLRANWKGFG